MGKRVERFEDLFVWQRARELTKAIYETTKAGAFARDFGLRDQIQRASVSVMSNIAEGFERGGRGEFHQFLTIAKGSCGEIRSQLYVALDVEHIGPEVFEDLKTKAEEVSKLISRLLVSIKHQRDTAKQSRKESEGSR